MKHACTIIGDGSHTGRRPDDDRRARAAHGHDRRNIRAHQSRGLLPPPELRGRTGYYGDDARRADRADPRAPGRGLQPRGDPAPDRGRRRRAEEVLRFTQAVREPFEQEEPRDRRPRRARRAVGRPRRPGSSSARSSSACCASSATGATRSAARGSARAGLELAALGVEPRRALDVIAAAAPARRGRRRRVRPALPRARSGSRSCEAAGREERWPEVRDALERLRPLAAEVLLAVFGLAMTDPVEKAFGRELERAAANPQRRRAPGARAGARPRSRRPRRGGRQRPCRSRISMKISTRRPSSWVPLTRRSSAIASRA